MPTKLAQKLLMRVSVPLILALGVCAGFSRESLSAVETESLRIIKLRGHAFVAVEGEAPRPLAVGDIVAIGSNIRTGPESALDLEGPAPAAIQMRLDANSRVVFLSSSQMELNEGDVFFKLARRGGAPAFEFKTPALVSSVRGTVFRVRHAVDRTSVYVFEGEIELTDAKDPARSIRLGPDEKIENYTGGDFPPLRHLTSDDKLGLAVFIADSPTGRNGTHFDVQVAEEAYYIVSSCRTEDNIAVCSDDAERKEEKEPDYEDFLILPGDTVNPPFRAALKRPESRLEMDQENVRYIFEGVMVICVELDPLTKKVKLALFQTVGLSYEIRRENDRIIVRTLSRNEYGLKNSTVRVAEGKVGVDVPWLCEGCTNTKTFEIAPGECFTFRSWTPSFSEMEIPVNPDPPKPRDAIGSEDQLR